VRNENGLSTTTVYWEPMHSDRYLHWTFNHPVRDKLSGTRTQVYRATTHYCFTASLKMAELARLRNTFADKGYLLDDFVEVALREGPKAAEEKAISGDRSLGKWEGAEELGTLAVPSIKELQPELRALCAKLNSKLLFTRERSTWATCWLLGDRPKTGCSRRTWFTKSLGSSAC